MKISPIMTGAPAAPSCLAEANVFSVLDRLQIPYQRVEHEAAGTMEDCMEISRVLGVSICKNLFLCNRQKTDFYLLCMPDSKPFHTKDLSHQIGSSRLSFAPPDEMERLIGCTPGSASILGLMNDSGHRVQLLLDRPVIQSEYFGCHPCKNDSSLRIRTDDLLQIFLPESGHEPMMVDLPDDSEEI